MKKSSMIIIVLGVLALIGLFFVFKPQSPDVSKQNNQLKKVNQPAVQKKVFTFTISDKKITSGTNTLEVTQGDDVTFVVRSDEEGELHLHGYDKHVDLQKDKPVSLRFTATIAGQFPFELEESKTDLGTLVVQPK